MPKEIEGLVFKTKVTNKEAHDLLAITQHATFDDLNTYIPIAKIFVEKWPYDGSPQEDSAYDSLDYADAFRLMRAVDKYAGEYIGKASKN